MNFFSSPIFLKDPNFLNNLSNLEISMQLQKGFEPKIIGTYVQCTWIQNFCVGKNRSIAKKVL